MTGPSDRKSTVLLFGWLGLASGLFMSGLHTPLRDAQPAAGLVFGIAFCIALAIARNQRWIHVQPTTRALIGFVVWVSVSYVIAMMVFVLIFAGLEAVVPRKVLNQYAFAVASLAFVVTGVFSAIAVCCGLAMLTGKWDRPATKVFLIVGVVSGPLAMLLRPGTVVYPSLYPVTQGLAGLATGYWLARATTTVENGD